MLFPKRLCIIGLPRSGSQYLVELLKNNATNRYTDLKEPFTYNLPRIVVDDNLQLSIESFPSIYDLYQDRVIYTNNVLRSGDINQSIIMRLFIVPEIETMLYDTIHNLVQKDFAFFILKRKNVINHILSIGIADARNQYKLIWSEPYDHTPVKVTNFQLMRWLHQSIKKYEKLIEENDISGQEIFYETAIEDLARIYDMPINICLPIKKQVIGDPYDHIINKDEVKEFILNLE